MGDCWITQIYLLFLQAWDPPTWVCTDTIKWESQYKEDFIYNYHTSRLQFGFFFLNLNDAIREGDAARLFGCFKFALLVEYNYKHSKYAYLLLHFFAKVLAVLSKEEAKRHLANRFSNSEGRRGGGEQAIGFTNGTPKFFTENGSESFLGNVTKRSAQRVARSLETLDEIMDGIQKDLDQKKPSGHHGTKDPEQAVKIILTDLMNGKVFHHTPGRCGYPSFKKESAIDIDFRDFFNWAHNHLMTWKGLYENPQRSNNNE